MISPAYVDHQGLRGRELRGPAGFRQVVEAARGWFSGLEVTVQDLVAEPDRVALRLRWRGTTPSGEAVTRETLELLHFEDGLAVEHWGAELRQSEPAAGGGA